MCPVPRYFILNFSPQAVCQRVPQDSIPFSSASKVNMGCGGSRTEVIEGEDATVEPRPKPPQARSKPSVPVPIPLATGGILPDSSSPAVAVTAPNPRPRRVDDRVNSEKWAKDLVSPSHNHQHRTRYPLPQGSGSSLCSVKALTSCSPAICVSTWEPSAPTSEQDRRKCPAARTHRGW